MLQLFTEIYHLFSLRSGINGAKSNFPPLFPFRMKAIIYFCNKGIASGAGLPNEATAGINILLYLSNEHPAMKKSVIPELLLLTITLCGPVPAVTAQARRVYTINQSEPRQKILHFGASDAWSMNRLGLWPEAQQRQIADWLFSTENDASGQPRGIGLSLWRFNLGAGSAEQGDSAQIKQNTRTDCFLRPDGTYDWTKQAGQRSFLRLARERGVPYLLAFLNSMPVYYTINGLATNTGRGGTINLRPDCYDRAAGFMARCMKGLEEHDGIRIDYLSPVNEPDGNWNWQGPKQEGSPATNREIATLVRAISKAFRKEKVNTAIAIPESSDLRNLLGVHQSGWQRGNEVSTFFDKDSTATCLRSVSNVLPAVLAHSYWTNTPVDSMRAIRQRLRRLLDRYGLAYWQSEICIMSNDEEIGRGSHFDTSMMTALYVARIMHYDLVYGGAESWSWWRAAGSDYKDGLIRILSADNWKTGKAIDSKLMWTMGNYSRFIRPGARRYTMTVSEDGRTIADGETQPTGVMASAYRNADGTWVVVGINYGEGSADISLPLPAGAAMWRLYRTSDVTGENLKPVGESSGTATLEPRSVTTFVSSGQ